MALTRKVKSGLTQAPFDTYVGEVGQIFFNNDTGEIRISDGVTPAGKPVYVAVTNANIGNLVITGTTIESLNTDESINIASNGLGSVNILGEFHVHSTAGGLSNPPVLKVDTNGFTTIKVPALTLGQTGLLINGDGDSTIALPQVSGTTFRSVGNDGMSNTMTIDSFGTNTFSTLTYRSGRGTGSAPTATQSGDTIGRLAAVGWGATNFAIDTVLGRAPTDIRFVATENYTDAHAGSKIQFFTSPTGGTVRTLSAEIYPDHIAPGVNNTQSLGSSSNRWKDLYLGPSSIHLQDTALLTDVQIQATNGTLYLNGVENLSVGNVNVGDLAITQNNITTVNANEDLNILTNGTGDINLVGNLHIHTTAQGPNSPSPVMSVLTGGLITVNAPTIPANSPGALNIVGSSDGSYQPITNSGSMLHITGNDGASARFTIDAFTDGISGQYPNITTRTARGSAAAPATPLSGDYLGRWNAGGWLQSGYVNGSGSVNWIGFKATENYSATAAGAQFEVQLVKPGTVTNQTALTVAYDGITTNSITANTIAVNGNLTVAGNAVVTKQLLITASGNIKFNDGSTQTTAAIQAIDNIDHITGAFAYVGIERKLQLSSDATPTNTPSTIVSRDGSGNIAVGNVTATTLNTTSVTANSSIAGSLTVYGNLNVVGTTVTTNAVVTTVDTKTFTIASNAVSAIAADGAAFLVGNIAGHSVADWTYDNGQTAWRSNISIVPAQDAGANLGSETRNWGNLYVTEAYVSNKLNVGITPLVDYLNVAQFTANVPQYSQIYNQNLSSNSGASTDFVAANDIGGESNNYIDMGINSSTYVEADYSVQYANDGYIFVNGGNVTFGTQTLGKSIVFHTDGTTADKEAGRVHLGRWILGGADDGVNKLQVGGNIIASNVNATNLTNNFNSITTTTTGLQNQINAANAAIVTANTAMKGYVDAVTTAWTANAATQANQITGANAAIVTANTAVVSYVNTLNTAMIANVVAANAAIVTANSAMKLYVDAVTTAWTANAASQEGEITGLRANITAANAAIVTANTAVVSYVNTQVSNAVTNANANTSAYLSNGISTNIVTTGNVNAGNVNVGATTYSNLAITTTATAADFTIGLAGSTGNLILNRNINAVKSILVSGNIRLDPTQNNGTVTQLTNKSTGVSVSGRTGQITTNGASLAKGAAVTFTVTNGYVVSNKDVVIVNIASGATTNSYAVCVTNVVAGAFDITISNNGTGPLTDTLVINFAIIRVS